MSMDGQTPIDTNLPQFTQRDASGVSGAPMGTINNWLDRGYLSLTQSPDRRFAGRRFFSVRDIIRIRAMFYCTKRFGLPASYAALIANNIANDLSSVSQPQSSNGKYMSTWYFVFRVLDEDGELSDDWGHDHVAYDEEKGQFLDFNDASKTPINPVEIASGFLAIPSSKLANTTFLQCADILSSASGNPAGLMTEGLPPMDF